MSAPVGERAQLSFRVTERDTAHAYGNSGVHVLGTPALVGWIEDTALAALAPHLDAGQHSVGTLVELRHEAPTALGDDVSIDAEVVAVDGREVTFALSASDSLERIATASHRRFVVDADRFLKRVEEKAR